MAKPFSGNFAADVIVDIGLALIDPPDEVSVGEIILSGRGEVSGWSSVGKARQIEAWSELGTGPLVDGTADATARAPLEFEATAPPARATPLDCAP